MNEKLKSKIAGVICDETDLGIDVCVELTEKIAALVDRDCIEKRDAVKRLIEWAEDYFSCHLFPNGFLEWEMSDTGNLPEHPWVKIIADGSYSKAATEEGLRDLFVGLLGGEE